MLLDPPTADLVKARSVVLKAVAIAAGIGLVLGLALAMLLAALRRDKPRVAAGAGRAPRPDRGTPTTSASRPDRTHHRGGHRAPAGSGVDLEQVYPARAPEPVYGRARHTARPGPRRPGPSCST